MPPKKKKSSSSRKRSRRSSPNDAAVSTEQDLSEDQQKQIKDAFVIFVTTKEDAPAAATSIRVKEAKYALQSLGVEMKRDEIKSWLPTRARGGNDGDCVVDLLSFTRMAAAKLVQKEKGERAFQLIDKNGKGVICLEDLQRVAIELDETITEEELQEMLEQADRSGQGLLSPQDFGKIVREINL